MNEFDWERLWAPYDNQTYQAILDEIDPQEVVLEIGAGDLRLAVELTRKVHQVIAIEIQPQLIQPYLTGTSRLPANLKLEVGDACLIPFPRGISTAVLLMRHCRHFQLFFDKLRDIDCQRLITNARWRMSVESIDLQADRMPYSRLELGWYACECGAVGFKPGSPDRIQPENIDSVSEVCACPNCVKV